MSSRPGRGQTVRTVKTVKTVKTQTRPSTGGTAMQKITPCLWFDTEAEEAASSTSRCS